MPVDSQSVVCEEPFTFELINGLFYMWNPVRGFTVLRPCTFLASLANAALAAAEFREAHPVIKLHRSD